MSKIEPPATPVAASAEALFRYRVVAQVLARVALGVLRADAVCEVVDDELVDVRCGRLRSTSRRTVYRWLAAYEREGLAGLEPRPRARASKIPNALVDFLRDEKGRDPQASIPELLRRAEAHGVPATIAGDRPVHRSTAFRALRRLGVPISIQSGKRELDMRRFAYPHRMRMVLADGKHFRAGARRLRRVAFFFLDDCSRRVLVAVVGRGPGEQSVVFLRGLFEVLSIDGLFDILYVDHGSAFDCRDVHVTCAALGIHVIHGRRRYPEGHAKVERFNRTASADCLRGLAAPDVDPEPGSLELRIRHYLATQYDLRPHEGLGNLSPRQKWERDERPLRFPWSTEALRARFFVPLTRRVSADNLVKIGGVLLELPRGYASSHVELHRHALDGYIALAHQGRLVRLHPVDLAANADAPRTTRSAARAADDLSEGEAPRTAASLAFDRDFGPVPGALPGASNDRKDR
jgi:transposase InsO family protein